MEEDKMMAAVEKCKDTNDRVQFLKDRNNFNKAADILTYSEIHPFLAMSCAQGEGGGGDERFTMRKPLFPPVRCFDTQPNSSQLETRLN
ncbi:hypothetical protein DPMN_141202 [Dreissena polymorpha]|uniref:Uncharacterized protein n=1 Tax=Dreissena polymorpha TaxID=45954 RepID=A0A9D4JL22_DREPO|nr:hypothetical protein DPMN_141202 [Dreissena polymorpha]